MSKNTDSSFTETVANHNNLRAFAFFSANLQKLCPEVPYGHHPALFMEATRYARLAMDDGLNINWADTFEPPADFLAGMREPGIIATFHTGPYRLLCMWLARVGIPLTVVVSADVARKQRDRNRDAFDRIEGATKAESYEYLLADDPMILRKMVRALQRGRFLVLYVDGHMGVGRNPQSRSSMVMEFMAHRLRVKTGVADVARLAHAPIYPVLAHFNDRDEPVLRRYGTLDPREAASGGRMQVAGWMARLYGHLQATVGRHPMQWEGWFYIHHDLVHGAVDAKGGILRYYLPFRLADRCFLLHKESFSAFPVPEQVYLKLKNIV